jgi:hypothetical protein
MNSHLIPIKGLQILSDFIFFVADNTIYFGSNFCMLVVCIISDGHLLQTRSSFPGYVRQADAVTASATGHANDITHNGLFRYQDVLHICSSIITKRILKFSYLYQNDRLFHLTFLPFLIKYSCLLGGIGSSSIVDEVMEDSDELNH